MPPRQRTVPLHLSERSNGLQFNRSFFHEINAPAGKYSKGGARLPPNGPIAHKRTHTVSSLLPPYMSASTKRGSNRNSAKRRSMSSVSIRSFASTHSRRRKYTPPPNINTLPAELIDEIASHLDQDTLRALALTCRATTESALVHLYAYPTFASTYRFAQFTSIVSHRPRLAFRTRGLDLSSLAAIDPEIPIAGWREWKCRNNPVYTIRREIMPQSPIVEKPHRRKGSSSKSKKDTGQKAAKKSSHPEPSPYLMPHSTNRDVPTGALLHIFKACPNIEYIDLSGVPLSQDYAVQSGKSAKSFKPTAFTQLLFVSDVDKQYTWKDGDTKPVSVTGDIVDAILVLQNLKEIVIKGSVWVSKDVVKRIIYGCKKLQKIDVTGSGMVSRSAWGTSAKTDHMKMIINELEHK